MNRRRQASVATFVFACCFPAPTNAQVTIDAPSRLAQLGAGFDGLANDIRGDCVESNLSSGEQTDGSETIYEIVKIEDEKKFSQQLNVSTRAKYGLFNAGGSYVSESSFNSYSLYLAVIASVKVRSKQIQGVKLTSEATALAKKNANHFRQRCGNYFVRNQTRGGEYSALVEVYTSTQEQRDKAELDIGGATGAFSGEAAAKSALSKVITNRRYSAKIIRKGTKTAIPNDADAVLGAVLAFPKDLSSLPDNELFTVAVDVQDYLTLNVPVELRQGALSDTQELLRLEQYDGYAQQRRALLGDVMYAIRNGEEFVPHDKQKLIDKAQQLNAVLFAMKSAIALCLDPLKRRCTATDFKAPSDDDLKFKLPDRLPGPTRQELQTRIDRSTKAVGALYDFKSIPDFVPLCFRGNCDQIQQAIINYCEREKCKPVP